MDEFLKELTVAIQNRSDHELSISSVEVIKNNDVKFTGINISRNDRKIGKNFYMDLLYQRYKNGEEVSDMAEEILSEYFRDNGCTEQKILSRINDISDYDSIKSFVVLSLVNREWNREYLADKYHVPFLDLAVAFRILMGRGKVGTATTAVSNDMFKRWDISEQELYETALINTMREFPGIIKSFENLLAERIIDPVKMPSINSAEIFGTGMYVLTNEMYMHGATAMLYKKQLRGFCETKGCNGAVIIPSSVNEVILIPNQEEICLDPVAIKEMIMDVNQIDVERMEWLSDHPYIYDSESDEIRDYSD